MTLAEQRKRWLAAHLAHERKRARMTQVQLANALNRSQSWVARIENGDIDISYLDFFRIADCMPNYRRFTRILLDLALFK